MMVERPEVSAIIIFKDEERFLNEAIDSVTAQTFRDWELILVDDGSVDRSTAIALEAAATRPGLVRYIQHDGGANRGMSASRNLGLALARGRYVAFLDGDDVWRPEKLAVQIAHLEQHPEAVMTTSPLLRWRRWSGDTDAWDREDLMGVGRKKHGKHRFAGRVVSPPRLARLMLADDYYIPGGALIRRSALDGVGRFEPTFTAMFEDAVMMLKICLRHPVHVGTEIGYLYRIHPDSYTQRTSSDVEIDAARARYLDWVGDYLETMPTRSPSLRFTYHRARRSTRHGRLRRHRLLNRARRVGRLLMPLAGRDQLRRWWFNRTRSPPTDCAATSHHARRTGPSPTGEDTCR